MVVFTLPDVFNDGMWPRVQELTDSKLRDLAESIPSIVSQYKALATVKRCAGAFSRWRRWANSKPGIQM